MERDNLWAPWRIGYITADKTIEGCFLCHHQTHEDQDDENLVLWRSVHCVVVMNRYPYNGGHMLCVLNRHKPMLTDCTPEELADLLAYLESLK